MDDILNSQEVAKILRINLQQVYKLIKSGRLKGCNVSAKDQRIHFRVKKSELDKFLTKGYGR